MLCSLERDNTRREFVGFPINKYCPFKFFLRPFSKKSASTLEWSFIYSTPRFSNSSKAALKPKAEIYDKVKLMDLAADLDNKSCFAFVSSGVLSTKPANRGTVLNNASEKIAKAIPPCPPSHL